ncbi:MAG TPA: hypothetical protein PLP19_08680 [bacterium]|nr:hypothetical protein [bacterium]HPN43548.1 hypothetical protein [bacterium]
MIIRKIFYALLFLYIPAALFAQPPVQRLQQQMSTLAGISFETWKAEQDRITQFALPITFIYPFNERSRLDVITSPALSTLSSGDSYSLNGLSDTRVRGHYLTANEKYLFTYGLVLPTGKSSLTTEEFNVANAVALHAFNFRVPSLGQGMDINLGIATAFQYNDNVIGAGFSILKKNNYKPFKDYDYNYQPGDEFTFTTGIERNITTMGKEARVTADLVYTIYSSDKGNDEEIFKSGNRFMLQSGIFIPFNNYDLQIFLREKIKGKNKAGVGDQFEQERKNRNGNEFQITGQVILPPKNTSQIIGLFDMMLFGNNQYKTGGATLFGLGGGYRYKINSTLFFDGQLWFYMGSMKTGVESKSLTGIKLNGGIRYYFH